MKVKYTKMKVKYTKQLFSQFINFKLLRRSLSSGAKIFLFLTLLQILILVLKQASISFMGLSFNEVANHIVFLYPEATLSEFVKIFLVLWPLLSLLVVYGYFINRFLQSTYLKIKILFSIAYLLFFFSQILSYPSFYENHCPFFLKKITYQLADFLNPQSLFLLSLFLLLLPLLAIVTLFAVNLWQKEQKKTFFTLSFLFSLLALFLYFLPKDLQENSQPKAPVVMLVADSLRYDRAYKKEVMPFLHSLSEEQDSVHFHDHIIGVPRTFPSWIEILSARYSPTTGIRHMFPGFSVRQKDFSHYVQKFKDRGYKTEVISNFAGDIFPRFKNGFDEIKTPSLNLPTLIKLGTLQSFPLFLPLLQSEILKTFFPVLGEDPTLNNPETLIKTALNDIKTSQKPLFLVVFFSSAHFPYAAPWPWYKKYSNKNYQGPFFFQKLPDIRGRDKNLSQEDKKQIKSLYDGALANIDFAIQNFFIHLKKLKLYDQSLIAITADHGESLFERNSGHGHGEHLFGEDVLKVPFILKRPSKKADQPIHIRQTTRSIDLMPTIIAMNFKDLKQNRPTQQSSFFHQKGLDLNPWINENRQNFPKLWAYSETGLWYSKSHSNIQKRLPYPGINSLLLFDSGRSGDIILRPSFEKQMITTKHRSIIQGCHKLIYQPSLAGVDISLYDRCKDPQNLEKLNLKKPLLLAELKEKFFKIIQKLEGPYTNLENFIVKE